MGPKNVRLKVNLIKLMKDDSEEVLQGLIPHIGAMLECLAESQIIGIERTVIKIISRALRNSATILRCYVIDRRIPFSWR